MEQLAFLECNGLLSCRGDGGGLWIDGVAEFFGGLEEGDSLGGDVYLSAGLGIAADAGVALAGTEAAEAANFDLVAGFEGPDDGVKEKVDDDFAVTSGEVSECGDLVYQVCFGHVVSFRTVGY